MADVLEREVAPTFGGVLEQQTRGEVDVQISTAKRYPRSIRAFIELATEMATLDEDTAAACFYALPRGGKTVEGPSARLAEICASAWGHMRIQARVVDEDERFVTARGESWDLQNNVAIGYEVRRRITDKNGKKFVDDMIGVTSNAAASIALRNAVFKVIPSAFWRPIYLKCRQVAVGKAETLANKRAKMLDYFQKMGVENVRVFGLLGIRGIEDVTLDHMATLHGLATAIKDGDTSVDEAFPIGGNGNGRTQTQQQQKAAPAGFQDWLLDMESVIAEGLDALEAAWGKSAPEFREHLTTVDSAAWETWKSKASAVDRDKLGI